MKLVFMGTPAVAVPCLKSLIESGHEIASVWTQPDRRAGRGKHLTPPPVKVFAQENGLEIFQPEKLRNAETIAHFTESGADAAIVVAYGRILTKSYLNAFRYGAINVHFSLLPKYRGAAPVNWAIVNGEAKTGVTTMKMDAGLDTGDILKQRETEIGATENAIDLMTRLTTIGASLLVETLADIESVRPMKQDESKASLAPLMEKSDGQVDWNRPAFEISNRIRGFQPFPKSYATFRKQGVTFWHALVSETVDQKSFKPGQIVSVDSDAITVKCGKESSLAITELQFEGKKRMEAKDAINGFQLKVGESFC